jgi:hypothetical protein
MLLTGVVLWRTAGLMQAWYYRQTAERSADYLGMILYAVVYLLVSVAILGAALVSGRRALKNHDPELLWRAGALAVVGGLQHLLLLGLPALCGGILALRAANRSSLRQPRSLASAICQSWGFRPEESVHEQEVAENSAAVQQPPPSPRGRGAGGEGPL